MQITNGAYYSYSAVAPQARSPQASEVKKESGSTDSVQLSDRHNGPSEILMAGGMGAIPGVGAFANLAGLIGAGASGKMGMARLGLAGGAANLIGTGAAVTGLLIGNSAATYAGLGLLAASGVSAAVIASAL